MGRPPGRNDQEAGTARAGQAQQMRLGFLLETAGTKENSGSFSTARLGFWVQQVLQGLHFEHLALKEVQKHASSCPRRNMLNRWGSLHEITFSLGTDPRSTGEVRIVFSSFRKSTNLEDCGSRKLMNRYLPTKMGGRVNALKLDGSEDSSCECLELDKPLSVSNILGGGV
ncbi:hypothetical protein TNIN_400541 [Trichonephila inaurata madagascariensis]|uniref:Uncharacterized protein n=1 Tax=Trichonephila inaurata madagascariensis TaxID=2747483 RepID=A0A8X6WZS4_9ARAC|nr:hypothetical protein TNIN_400541 [Trichonephila inaurata madagascariensis]